MITLPDSLVKQGNGKGNWISIELLIKKLKGLNEPKCEFMVKI